MRALYPQIKYNRYLINDVQRRQSLQLSFQHAYTIHGMYGQWNQWDLFDDII